MTHDTFIDALAKKLSAGAVLTDPADMAPYLTDWRGRFNGRARAVVRPANTDEVARVVAACEAEKIALVPQGGNTGLCGGATPSAAGDEIVLCLSRMKTIRHIDPLDNTLTVDAGVTLADAQAAAATVGRLFPLSLASEGSCQIGGNLSTNAGGVHVLRYGTMRDLVLGLEVVLPDGRIWHGLRRLRKDNTGFDLKHLFIGAEGTLGIITGAVLKLFPRPRSNATAWLALPSVEAAVSLLAELRAHFGERISAFELVSRVSLDLVLQHIPDTRDPLAEKAPWYVLVELADTLPDFDLETRLETALGAALEDGRVIDATLAQSGAQAAALWALREHISDAQKREGFSIKHDISLPVSAIARFIAQADAALQAAFPGVRIVTFGHVGDGNLHYNLSQPVSADNAAFIAQTPAANRIVHDLVAALEGSISAEHGLGQLKRDEILLYKSDTEMALMRAIKSAIDPHSQMNPGKVL